MSASLYLRAARRRNGDPEAIFQTARAELEPKHLARLVDALRDAHPGWKLRKRDRDSLVDALLDEEVAAPKIADRLGCHVKTVRRRAQAREPTPEHRMDKRCEVDKTRPRVSLPILSAPSREVDALLHGDDALYRATIRRLAEVAT